MSDFTLTNVPWCVSGQCGPNEVDLMRAMQFLVNTYKSDVLRNEGQPDDEVRRCVNWLHSRYGGGDG